MEPGERRLREQIDSAQAWGSFGSKWDRVDKIPPFFQEDRLVNALPKEGDASLFASGKYCPIQTVEEDYINYKECISEDTEIQDM